MELFFDNFAVSSSSGLKRRWYSPVKYSGNPVLGPDRPWEGSEVFPHMALLWDKDDHLYKCWYRTGGDWPTGGDRSYLALATSWDGLAWDKPILGKVSFGGTKNNNLIMTTPIIESFTWSIVKDPRETDPSRRYKSLGFDFQHDSVNTNIEGFSPFHPIEGKAIPNVPIGIVTGYSPDGIEWRRNDQRLVFPRGIVTDMDSVSGYDETIGRWIGIFRMRTNPKRRFLCRTESADFEHWAFPKLILGPDVEEPPEINFYGMNIHRRGTHHIGFVWIYHDRPDNLHMEAQLAYSRDGWHWIRCAERKPILTYSRDSSAWDCGMVFPLVNFLVNGEFRLYYRGTNHLHESPPDYPQPPYGTLVNGRPVIAALGMATLKQDRFVSLCAEAEGVMTTPFFVVAGDHININALTQNNGIIHYELLDHQGRPIPGYTRYECDPFVGDSIHQVLTWKNSRDLRPLLGKGQNHGRIGYVMALRFYLKGAEIFSYEVAET